MYTDSVPGLNVAGAIDKLFFDGYGNQWVNQHVYNDCYPGYKKTKLYNVKNGHAVPLAGSMH